MLLFDATPRSNSFKNRLFSDAPAPANGNLNYIFIFCHRRFLLCMFVHNIITQVLLLRTHYD